MGTANNAPRPHASSSFARLIPDHAQSPTDFDETIRRLSAMASAGNRDADAALRIMVDFEFL